MHEGLSEAEFEALKQRAIRTNQVKEIEWWKLTEKQLESRIGKFNVPAQETARKIWTVGPGWDTEIDKLGDVKLYELKPKSETSIVGWFKYFLQEALNTTPLSANDSATILRICKAYLKKRNWREGTELKAPLESADPNTLRQDLTSLLRIGFHKFSGFGADYDQNDCSDVALLQFRRSGQVYQEIDYRFRADSRDFQSIKQSDGFHAKADSEGYAKANLMRAPFHPFSDPQVRKYLWFRRGQTDNCLYSVVSVGTTMDWEGYLPFPKVYEALDARLFSEPNMVPMSNSFSQRFAMCRVDGKSIESIKLPCTETWIYMFLLNGFVLETNRIQKHINPESTPFPEEGVRDIPLQDVFGAIRFYRFHHGPKDDDGFTAVVDPSGAVEQYTNPFFQAAKYSNRGYEKLRSVFQAMYDKASAGPMSMRWTATGHQTIDSKFDYCGKNLEVLEMSLQS